MFPIQNAVPTRSPPLVTWALITTNCIVFLLQLSLDPADLEEFLGRFALIPAHYGAGAGLSPADYLAFFTMMFIHGGWLHLIFNMWTLWLFGPAIEDRMGHARYFAFYIAAGVLAAITHVIFNPGSTVPALGASGAIAGVMGCYVRLFPWSRLIVVVPILFLPLFFQVPAIVFVGIWIALQVLQGTIELLGPAAGEGIAWWVHVGGFATGLVLGPLLLKPARLYRPYFPDEGRLGFNVMGR
jgi:membrane associated rhomboid family serine protease